MTDAIVATGASATGNQWLTNLWRPTETRPPGKDEVPPVRSAREEATGGFCRLSDSPLILGSLGPLRACLGDNSSVEAHCRGQEDGAARGSRPCPASATGSTGSAASFTCIAGALRGTIRASCTASAETADRPPAAPFGWVSPCRSGPSSRRPKRPRRPGQSQLSYSGAGPCWAARHREAAVLGGHERSRWVGITTGHHTCVHRTLTPERARKRVRGSPRCFAM
jgi:hypothetical protein